MISHYSFAFSREKLLQKLPVISNKAEYNRSYNFRPLDHCPIIIQNEQTIQLVNAVWGLLPHWTKEQINYGNLFNAQAIGIASKPSYRIPIRKHRCLIPADSYYVADSGKDNTYRVLKRDKSISFFAGMYDVITNDKGTYISFTMITTAPNRDLSDIKRPMPVVLNENLHTDWLNPSLSLNDVLALLTVPENYQWIYYAINDGLLEKDTSELHEQIVLERTLFD